MGYEGIVSMELSVTEGFGSSWELMLLHCDNRGWVVRLIRQAYPSNC